jgi:hypothetical protein
VSVLRGQSARRPPASADGFRPDTARQQTFVPNAFSPGLRMTAIFGALFFLAFALSFLAFGHAAVPTGRGGLLVLTGAALWMAAAAAALFTVALLGLVLDHYDTRDNEARHLRKWCAGLGLALGFFAPMVQLILGDTPSAYRGFAEDVSLYHASYPAIAETLHALLKSPVVMLLVFGPMALGLLVLLGCKLLRREGDRLQGLAGIFMLLPFWCFGLLMSVHKFFAGRYEFRDNFVLAGEQPGLFYALSTSAILLSLALIALTLIALRQILRYPRDPARKARAWR